MGHAGSNCLAEVLARMRRAGSNCSAEVGDAGRMCFAEVLARMRHARSNCLAELFFKERSCSELLRSGGSCNAACKEQLYSRGAFNDG